MKFIKPVASTAIALFLSISFINLTYSDPLVGTPLVTSEATPTPSTATRENAPDYSWFTNPLSGRTPTATPSATPSSFCFNTSDNYVGVVPTANPLDKYKYLCIGNSLTLVPELEGQWFSDSGMAASDSRHDYYALLGSGLKESNTYVEGRRLNYSSWEMFEGRGDKLSYLDRYLSADLDLVVIQLGENVHEMGSFPEDYRLLIEYVKLKAPYAKIITVGNFFYDVDDIDAVKEEISKEEGVTFVSLDKIRNRRDIGNIDNVVFSQYEKGVGNYVYDKNGIAHVIEDKFIGVHPNDLGMLYIANEILKALDKAPAPVAPTVPAAFTAATATPSSTAVPYGVLPTATPAATPSSPPTPLYFFVPF